MSADGSQSEPSATGSRQATHTEQRPPLLTVLFAELKGQEKRRWSPFIPPFQVGPQELLSEPGIDSVFQDRGKT